METLLQWLGYAAYSAVIILPMMLVCWAFSEKIRNAGIVDILWAASYGLLALVFAMTLPGLADRRMLLLAAVLPWSFRLASYLFQRFKREFPHEDGRYRAMRDAWKEKACMNMLWVFLFQGFLIIVLSIPLAVIAADSTPQLRTTDYIGAALCLFGFAGEWVADHQLSVFKHVPENKGKVCTAGLWNYSRHPNYFFEWLVWVGIYTMAINSPGGIFTVFAPALMLFLLTKVSGVKMTEEQAAKSRGEAYVLYTKTTSPFVPWFKLKG